MSEIDFSDLYEGLDEGPVPAGSKLEALLEEYEALDKQIAQIEGTLSELKAKRKFLLECTVPDYLQELGGLTKAETDKLAVKVEPFYSAKVLDFDAAESYLTGEGDSGIIKSVMEVPLGRLEEAGAEVRETLRGVLGSYGLDYAEKKSIHPQTLAAYVRRKREAGEELPKDAFSVYEGRVAKIKSK